MKLFLEKKSGSIWPWKFPFGVTKMKKQKIEGQQEKYEKNNFENNIEYIRIISCFGNQADETSYENKVNKIIHKTHNNLAADLQIPFLYIDPVVDIFEDPCDANTTHVTTREKEQFQKYTDKYV